MNNKKLTFLIFGKIPPPKGGVTVSIQNLIESLKVRNIHSEIISFSHLWKFNKFDIGHIHYSRKIKVIVAILLSKLLTKKTIVTKHGANFHPKNNGLDKLILYLCDGMIVLNEDVYQRILQKKNLILLPPIFKEGINLHTHSTQTYLQKEKNQNYLLLYASHKAYIQREEVYGVHFILELFAELPSNVVLVFLDPSKAYASDVKNMHHSKLIYMDGYVNFKQLVSEVNLYIRPTSTDGNSIATLEALVMGTPVLASDCIQRADNIQTYKLHDKADFVLQLNKLLDNKNKPSHTFKALSIQNYLDFCQTILKGS
jgi:glycosyltransferase involved in cell wall biosynthesis